MGSLLKEYVTKKQDESNDADSGNKEDASASEDKLSEAKDDAECIKDEEVKDEKMQDESNCVTENISSKLHQFDNVVAIVDPPRVGLHPTVSNYLFIICIGGSFNSFYGWVNLGSYLNISGPNG